MEASRNSLTQAAWAALTVYGVIVLQQSSLSASSITEGKEIMDSMHASKR
jgi:hypothetical protein